MTLNDVAQHIDDIVVISTGLIALSGLWWSFFKWLLPLLRDIHKSFKQLDSIASEFKANGGFTLKDAMNRLENNVQKVREDAIKMEARQWAVIATLRDPIFEANSEGQCVRANPSFLTLTERTMEEIVGNGWENIIHPDDRVRAWGEWTDAIDRQRTFESSYRVRSTSGVIYQVMCIALPFFPIDDHNTPIGYIGRFEYVKKITTKT